MRCDVRILHLKNIFFVKNFSYIFLVNTDIHYSEEILVVVMFCSKFVQKKWNEICKIKKK